jgi:hypothetical protein
MFPPDAIVLAATRWLRLLRSSSLGQASEIIRAGAGFADLTQTQYASGLEWLRNLKLLTEGSEGLELSQTASELPREQLSQLFFQRVLEQTTPAWLPDADVLVQEPSELPQDAAALAARLGLNEVEAFAVIKQLHGRIDLAERARVGAAGESALVEILERQWPRSTTHIAKTDDGFGYDVIFRHENINWHLEVKTTMRRGRLIIYLSRHEHEVGLRDPNWRLVVVGLDNKLRPRALATINHSEVLARAPKDLYSEAKWQSVSHELTTRDLNRGLSFVDVFTGKHEVCADSVTKDAENKSNYSFSWMP